MFKNYLPARGAGFIQVDAVRVAGVSEFLAVRLLSQKFGVPVVSQVGDMGQLHPHRVGFNRRPSPTQWFFPNTPRNAANTSVLAAASRAGVDQIPLEPGASCDRKSRGLTQSGRAECSDEAAPGGFACPRSVNARSLRTPRDLSVPQR